MSLKGKKILLGVSGSIAAYKSAILTRELVKAGAEVKVIMTSKAKEFISPLTLATLSKNPCLVDYTNADQTDWNNHVALGLWGDALLIAPATANTIAKMANGYCDNLLMGVYLSARCPVFVAPAMDEDMYRHASTQTNLEKLRSYNNQIIPVKSGELASGLIGPGRMAEPHEIIEFLNINLNPVQSNLNGKKILITAGPTYESIDPVRYIGNHSTGKMGISLADEANKRGAQVHLILGPSHLLPETKGISITKVTSGQEMLNACQKLFKKVDVAIFSAAVADYTPENAATQKIKKKGHSMDLTLVKTPDIAYEFGQIKKGKQLSIGFALETEKELVNAKEKIKKKNFDLIVLNSLNDAGAGFKHATNKVSIISKDNKVDSYELKSKELVAKDILNKLETLL